jgi:hypothetical protein
MSRTEAKRHQEFDRLADQLGLGVTKQFDRARISCSNYAIAVRYKDRVWRNLKQVLHIELSVPGPVVLSGIHGVLIRGMGRAHGMLQAKIRGKICLIVVIKRQEFLLCQTWPRSFGGVLKSGQP